MNDTARVRAVFITLFIATLASMLGMGIIEPILPLYAKSMGASGFMVGLIFAGFALARGIFAPIIGDFSDQHGRKKLMLGGLALYVLFSLAYVVSDTPLMLLAVRFMQGFASVMVTPIAQSYIGDITPRGKEGSYMNLFFMSLVTGMAIGPALGGWLADAFSIAAPFYGMAVLSALSFLFVALFVPESTALESAEERKRLPIHHAFRKVMHDNPMRGVMVYIVARGFTRWGFNTFFPIFAIHTLAMNLTDIGLFLSAYMLIGALLQYPAGLFSDRYHQHRERIVLVSGALSTLPMFVIPLLSSLPLIFMLMVFMGASSVFARASSIAIRTERGRLYGMGAVAGAFTASMSVGQILGPITFGILYDFFGIDFSFAAGGAIGLVGAVLAFRFLRKTAKDWPGQFRATRVAG